MITFKPVIRNIRADGYAAVRCISELQKIVKAITLKQITSPKSNNFQAQN